MGRGAGTKNAGGAVGTSSSAKATSPGIANNRPHPANHRTSARPWVTAEESNPLRLYNDARRQDRAIKRVNSMAVAHVQGGVTPPLYPGFLTGG